MSSSEQKPNPDRQPVTVGHAKKLYEQSKSISNQVQALAPLLALLDQASSESDQDPIIRIIQLLETLTDHSTRHTALLQAIDGKLQFLLANSHMGDL